MPLSSDDADVRRFVFAVEVIEALLLGVVGLVAIDDLFEVTADADFLHRLMLIAPPAGGHEHVAQTGGFGFL